jgi:uncharacterized protein YkwD
MMLDLNLRQAGYVLGALCMIFVTPACAGTTSTKTRKDPYAEARAHTVAEINAYRAKVRLSPLVHWAEADSCSDEEARKDSKANESHQSFGACGEMAQNECPDWPDKDSIASGCMEQMWNEGPGKDFARHGHYLNMTNPKYTKVSIGFYTTREGKVWSVQNFK